MVSKDDIKKLSALAYLEFSDSEFNRITADMDSIIAFADRINNSIKGDAAETGAVLSSFVTADELRDDTVMLSYPVEQVTSNTDCQDNMFVALGGI